MESQGQGVSLKDCGITESNSTFTVLVPDSGAAWPPALLAERKYLGELAPKDRRQGQLPDRPQIRSFYL